MSFLTEIAKRILHNEINLDLDLDLDLFEEVEVFTVRFTAVSEILCTKAVTSLVRSLKRNRSE